MKDNNFDEDEVVIIIDDNDDDKQQSNLVNKYLLGNQDIIKNSDTEEVNIINNKIELSNTDILKKYNLDEVNPIVDEYLLGNKNLVNNNHNNYEQEKIEEEIKDVNILDRYNLNNQESSVEISNEVPVIENIDNEIPVIEDLPVIDNNEPLESITIATQEEKLNNDEDNKSNEVLTEDNKLNEILDLNTNEEAVSENQNILEQDKKEFDTNTFKNDDINNVVVKKKESKLKRILITLFLIIVLIMLSICGVLYFYNANYKIVIKKSANELISYKNFFEKPYILNKNDNKSIIGNMVLSINDDYKKIYAPTDNKYKYYDFINNLNLTYSMKKENDKFEYNLGFNQSDTEKLGFTFNHSNHKEYILFKEIYDKYIELNSTLGLLNAKNILSDEEYNYIIKFCYNSFFSHLDKHSYSIVKEKMDIKSKKIDVKKTTIKLDDEELTDIINLIIKDIKTDNTCDEIIRKLTGNGANSIKDISIKDKEILNKYEYVVYTQGIFGEVSKVNFKITKPYKSYNYSWDDLTNNTYESKDYTIKESTVSFIYEDMDKPTLSIYDEDKLENKYEFIKENNNRIINFYNEENKKIGYLKAVLENNEYTIDMHQADENQEADYKINMNIKEIKSNEEYDVSIKGNFDVKDAFYDTEPTNLVVNAAFKVKNGSSDNIEDIKDSVKFDELSEDEKNQIFLNIFMKVYELTGNEVNTESNTDSTVPSLFKFQK